MVNKPQMSSSCRHSTDIHAECALLSKEYMNCKKISKIASRVSRESTVFHHYVFETQNLVRRPLCLWVLPTVFVRNALYLTSVFAYSVNTTC